MIKVIESLIPLGTAARPGIKRNGYLGITIHNTDNFNVGANAKAHMLYQTVNGGQNQEVSYHYVVDDKEAYRLVPESEITWHAGDGFSGNGNNKTISIEICCNADGDIKKATDNAVELCKDIIKSLGGKLYQHSDWSGKNCPSQIRAGKPYSWNEFVKKVGSSNGNISNGGTGTSKKVYQLNDVKKVNGIWQLKCNALVPVAFSWNDNGIPLDDIDFTDSKGNRLGNQQWDGSQR
ncbi:MAG: N-acetylmuramoyl-L-alanine amidase, partial [Coprobacillaceae bacterium]